MPFDPDKYLEQKRKIKGIEPEAESSEPNVSTTESLLRGAAQGASLGFADELTGAGEAGIEKLLRDNPEEFKKLYEKSREESRQAYKKAEEAHPIAYMGGAIGGGIAPALLTGGAGEAGALATIGKAALAGGAAGAGTSEADLTKPDQEQMLQLGKDVGLGAGLGAGAAGTGEALKALTKFGLGKTVKEAYEQGKQGNMLVGEEARKGLQKKIVNLAEGTQEDIQARIKENAMKQGELLKQAEEQGTRISTQPLQEMAEQEIEKMPRAFGEAKKGRAELRKLLAEPSEGAQGPEFMQAANDALEKGAKITDVLESGQELGPKDFIGFKRALGRLGYEKDLKDDQVIALAKRLSGKASDIAEEKIPGLAEVNKNISSLRGAQDVFNIGGQAEDELGNVKKLSPLIEKLDKENLQGELAQHQFQKALESLKQSDPQMGAKLEKEFYDLSKQAHVAKKISGSDSLYSRHLLKGAGTAAANLGGLGVSKMKLQPIVDSMGAAVKTTVPTAEIMKAEDINKEQESPKSSPPGAMLYKLPDEELIPHLEQTVGQHPQFADRVNLIKDAVNKSDSVRRDQLLFSLVQNPTFRAATQSDETGEENG